MGLEAVCTARFGGKRSAGKARLEQKTLEFRGDYFRLDIPLAQIHRAQAKRGTLEVDFEGGTAAFALGAAAEKWALKIRYPKSVIDKLGVKHGMQIGFTGAVDRARDAGFWRDVEARAADVHDLSRKPRRPLDLVFFFAEASADLARLRSFEPHITRSGAIWVVYPKGVQTIREADVLGAGKQAILVDVKIVSFSETHSALKMMIPLARR